MMEALKVMGPPLMAAEGVTTALPLSICDANLDQHRPVGGDRFGRTRTPCVLVVARDGGEDALPFGPFEPATQRTLEQGLRKWVGEQTRFDLGYTEQLYTFGDRGRHPPAAG